MVSIKDRPVHYRDDLAGTYTQDVRAVKTLRGLLAAVRRWEPVAGDAFDVVAAMSESDFVDYEKEAAKERRGRFAGEPWCARFGAILIPETLLRISTLADQFKAPEGTVFIRAVETGRLKLRKGRYYDTVVDKATSREAD